MAIKHPGNKAPYLFDDECRWCTGSNNEILTSNSFGSCAGLVLFSPKHHIGVVAHYAGGLGHKKFRRKVSVDTQEILRNVCPISPGIWKAWVFGGVSLTKNTEHRTATEGQTKALIDAIRHELLINKYIPINSLKNNPEFQKPEMTDGYVGHSAVFLDVGTGVVRWE